MTTNLEKQFFDTFGIEPIIYCSKPILDCGARKSVTCAKDCEYYSGVLYPQITDRILLELYCITMQIYDELAMYRVYTIEGVKEKTLKLLIKAQDDAYSKVQALFKE